MPITFVRLGSERAQNEGLRIGTVRRPPRGVPKTEFASRNYYDVWLPNLSPSADLVSLAQSSKEEQSWKKFSRLFRTEMNENEASKVLILLAALSHQTNFSLGCYCENESRCHRSILKEMLAGLGAKFNS